jgi:hypothetical protein
MTRTRLFIAASLAGLALTACGGGEFDRDGFRDELVTAAEEAGGSIDPDCIDAALDKYSDDQIEAMDEAIKNNETSADADALQGEIIGCISIGS